MLLPDAVRSGIAVPKQALWLVAVGAEGVGLTTTEAVLNGPEHPLLFAVTE